MSRLPPCLSAGQKHCRQAGALTARRAPPPRPAWQASGGDDGVLRVWDLRSLADNAFVANFAYHRWVGWGREAVATGSLPCGDGGAGACRPSHPHSRAFLEG